MWRPACDYSPQLAAEENLCRGQIEQQSGRCPPITLDILSLNFTGERMMAFQVHALDGNKFSNLFDLDDMALEAIGARRKTVDSKPGYPCRVSLTDAEIGDTVVLFNYEHLPENSPYRASHAIYVRKGVEQARPAPNEVPVVIGSRLLSVRCFGVDHLMVQADVVDGKDLGPMIETMFQNPDIDYIHVHNARQGCFAAKVTRSTGGLE